MSAEVGGRLEAVAPRRSLFGPDYLRLAVLLAVAAGVHVWLVAHTAVPARDSLGFARLALNLSDPNAAGPFGEGRQRIEVVRTAEQPPGYPVVVWLTEKALRLVTDRPLADRALLAAQIANAFAATLLVIPVYLIGRILFGRNVGFAAALLFQVLPVPARVTSDGLSEGVYLLVTAVAVLLGVRAVRRPGVGVFLLCGVATGASYLVRPEGLMVGLAVGAVAAGAGMARRWPRDLALGRVTALAVGVALVALPYMVLIGKITNKPTGAYITNPLDTQAPPIWRGQPGAQAPAAGGGGVALFAEWWNPKEDEGKCRELWALGAVSKELIKSLHYAVGGLALFGLLAHRRQLFAPDPGLWVLVLLAAISFTLMTYLAARVGYVSERHTLLFVMVACVFAAAALEPFSHLVGSLPAVGRLLIWPKAAPASLLAALVVAALPYTLKTMHPQREGHKHAGRWLASRVGPDDWLVDPLTWGEWYAGRTLYKTVEYHGRPPVTWVIVESGKVGPHSRLPQWEHANALKAVGTLVYQWPEAATDDQPTVQVYKVVHHYPPPKKP